MDRASEQFWKLFAALPGHIQEIARKQFHLYQSNPDHPSVNFKPLRHTKRPVWSARINDNYRALAVRAMDEQGRPIMLWFWIGTHAEYDSITTRL